MPSAVAIWLPGSDSTVKVRSLVSAIDSEPSGFCGLIAISPTPRSASSGTSWSW
jgi:hypothetical protein